MMVLLATIGCFVVMTGLIKQNGHIILLGALLFGVGVAANAYFLQ